MIIIACCPARNAPSYPQTTQLNEITPLSAAGKGPFPKAHKQAALLGQYLYICQHARAAWLPQAQDIGLPHVPGQTNMHYAIPRFSQICRIRSGCTEPRTFMS